MATWCQFEFLHQCQQSLSDDWYMTLPSFPVEDPVLNEMKIEGQGSDNDSVHRS